MTEGQEYLQFGLCDGEGCPGCPAAGLSREKRRLIEREVALAAVYPSLIEKEIDIEGMAADGDLPTGRVLLEPGDVSRLAQATQMIVDGECTHHELVNE